MACGYTRNNSILVFCESLSNLANEVCASPRRSKCMLLIGIIASFLAQYCTRGREVVLKLVRTARQLAADAQLAAARIRDMDPSSNTIPERRARECIFYGHAVLYHTHIDDVDERMLVEIVELVVRFRNASLFAGSCEQTQIALLGHEIERIMIRHVARLLVTFSEENGTRITDICRMVDQCFPEALAWKRSNRQGTVCFEAIDPMSGVHYAVNFLTGAILVDGSAPGGLPAEIRALPRYNRLFGRRDFEVANIKGVFRSQNPTDGVFYCFRAIKGDLIVEEQWVDDAGSKTLQLVSTSWVHSVQDIVPARVTVMHSLWLWVESGCVLARGPCAANRDVEFVFVPVPQTTQLACFCVPPCEQSLPYDTIVQRVRRYSQLIHPHPHVLAVLGKFEERSYLHVLREPSGSISVELPRFGLQFSQKSQSRFDSVNYNGYSLLSRQYYKDLMPRYHRYLVLERNRADPMQPRIRLLMPLGEVIKTTNGNVDVKLPSDAASQVSVIIADEHPRFGTLTVESIEGRLQLAALFTANAGRLPNKALRMTGDQMAALLLRGCYPSRPYSDLSKLLLQKVASFASNQPSVKLEVSILMKKSNQTSFMFEGVVCDEQETEICDELDEYEIRATSRSQCPWGLHLSENGERELFGEAGCWHSQPSFGTASKECSGMGCRIDAAFVHSIEKNLASLLSVEAVEGALLRGDTEEFPLDALASNEMGKHMTSELNRSWHCYSSLQAHEHSLETVGVLMALKTLSRDVAQAITAVEEGIMKLINSNSTTERRLLTAISYFADATPLNIVQSTLYSEALLQLAPHLNATSRRCLFTTSLRLMELWVLEDRIDRIKWRLNEGSALNLSAAAADLKCVRSWKSEEFPYWLAFEVEGRLQIRPEQFVIADHLINNPGAVCQLNMGRGKTRVVLPMLFLYFAFQDRHQHQIVRAHFLRSLLSETRQFMNRALTSGVLNIPFLELPFHRNVVLGYQQVRMMEQLIDDVKRRRGFIVIAPEHRLSLELKHCEFQLKDDTDDVDDVSPHLESILDGQQYVDILDESDALLHHKYHLVYAVGTTCELDSGPHRWTMSEVILRVLVSRTSNLRQVLLATPHMFVVEHDYKSRIGAFDGIRLQSARDDPESCRAAFREALVEDLIRCDLFEPKWLQAMVNGCTCDDRRRLVRLLTDPTVALEDSLDGVLVNRSQLLALRGLIAFGVLESCLEKRYRVDYGLPEPRTRSKCLAIPFVAADLPSERSEFSHPDVAITLTFLAYYHAGLRQSELRQAFEILLSLDEAEQHRYYGEWFDSVYADLSVSERVSLGTVDRIAMDDSRQFRLLVNVYRYAMVVINFYVKRVVFPRDTKQYPQRLCRSSWDLVRESPAIGFSGTKDNHRLLPLTVKQLEPRDDELRGTDGRMLALMKRATRSIDVLRPDESEEPILWRLMLNHAIATNCQALIDTGALLAGVPLHEAASYLITTTRLTALGVTFYDSRPTFDCWVVMDVARRCITPLKNSPIQERDTFVLFDEARSRGSDMKMDPAVMAMLTLGPKLTKDKLMQGAGRMRQLGCDQSLLVACTEEVWSRLTRVTKPPGAVTAVTVLSWAMINSQLECTSGLIEWAESGLQCAARTLDASTAVVDEDWTLEGQYGRAQTPQLIADIVANKIAKLVGNVDGSVVEALVTQIKDHGLKFGRDDVVHVSAFGEECERELQVEEEQIMIKERPKLDCLPYPETMWDVSLLLTATSATQLQPHINLITMADGVAKYAHPRDCRLAAWDQTKLFGTKNFWCTVVPKKPEARVIWNRFLRFIDMVLLFRDGSVLMLSPFEADHVLGLLRSDTSSRARGGFTLIHLEYAVDALRRRGDAARVRDVRLALSCPLKDAALGAMSLPLVALVACRLVNGDSNFLSASQPELTYRALQSLLEPLPRREETLRAFLDARGFPHRWNRSFLHELAVEMDLGLTRSSR